MAWLKGTTKDGTTVLIKNDPYLQPNEPVLINGEETKVLHVRRLRDGGSTYIDTEAGPIRWKRNFGTDIVPTFNGEKITIDE